MGLRGKVDDNVRFFLLKQLIDTFPVANIHADKTEIRPVHDRRQGGKVPCVSQLVNTYDPVFRMFLQFIINKIAPDKSGAAGHDDGHSTLHSCQIISGSLLPIIAYLRWNKTAGRISTEFPHFRYCTGTSKGVYIYALNARSKSPPRKKTEPGLRNSAVLRKKSLMRA